MKVGQYCKRGVSALGAKADLVEAAQAMRDNHIWARLRENCSRETFPRSGL
jgi:hypothetical protein